MHGTRRGCWLGRGEHTDVPAADHSLPNRQLHVSAAHCFAAQDFEKLITKSRSQVKELRGQCQDLTAKHVLLHYLQSA